MDALKGMFPIEPGALEEVIEMNWSSWDTDMNGTIGEATLRNLCFAASHLQYDS